MRTEALNHVAMSFPPGTLTGDFRTAVADFYGALLGWDEIDRLRLDDRMTLHAGGDTYVNLRERDEAMTCTGYEHIGATVASGTIADAIWRELAASDLPVELGEMKRGDDGFRSFRFRYLLPMAIEIQYFPN